MTTKTLAIAAVAFLLGLPLMAYFFPFPRRVAPHQTKICATSQWDSRPPFIPCSEVDGNTVFPL